MAFLGSLRRWIAHKVYTPPEVKTEDMRLSSRGVFEYALDSRVKRDVIRDLAYHMGARKQYSEDGGSYGINYLGDWAVYDSEFPVSTDMTDYDSKDEYFDVVRDAKRKHLVNCLRDAVEAKVLEFHLKTEYTTDHTVDYTKVTGVRPGPRFEFAVQSLWFVDEITDNLHKWDTSI